jgi:hypothetical protein
LPLAEFDTNENFDEINLNSNSKGVTNTSQSSVGMLTTQNTRSQAPNASIQASNNTIEINHSNKLNLSSLYLLIILVSILFI